MRVVIDTSVMVAGLRSNLGAAHHVLRMVYDGDLLPLASTALFLEYEDVLTRPTFLTAAGLDFDEIGIFLAGFAALISPVTIDVSWRPVSNDPDDDRVLDCAINGGALAIITHNVRDLDIARRFGISVLRPGNLIWRLRR